MSIYIFNFLILIVNFRSNSVLYRYLILNCVFSLIAEAPLNLTCQEFHHLIAVHTAAEPKGHDSLLGNCKTA